MMVFINYIQFSTGLVDYFFNFHYFKNCVGMKLAEEIICRPTINTGVKMLLK